MDICRVGLIGCGPMGRGLITSAHQLPQLSQVNAVCDLDADIGKEVAEAVEAEYVADIESFVERDDIDAIIVAVPQFAHREAALATIAAGKHVFVEKPMAVNVDDCQAMIDAAAKQGVKLMVGQVLRYLGPFKFALDHVPDLGELFAVRITRSGSGWGSVAAWRRELKRSGGILFEVDVHEIDFMRCCLGNATSVYALSNPRPNPCGADYSDTFFATIGFEDGGLAQLAASQADHVGVYRGEILGTNGAVHFNQSSGELKYRFGDGELTTLAIGDLGYPNAVEFEVEQFLRAVVDDTPVPIPGEEGMAAVEIAQGAMSSQESGQVVPLSVST